MQDSCNAGQWKTGFREVFKPAVVVRRLKLLRIFLSITIFWGKAQN